MVWEISFVLQDLKGIEVGYFCSLDHTGKCIFVFPSSKNSQLSRGSSLGCYVYISPLFSLLVQECSHNPQLAHIFRDLKKSF